MALINTLQLIAETSSRKEKEQLLLKYESDDFKRLAKYTYNQFVNYYTNTIPEYSVEDETKDFEDMFKVLDKLATGVYRGQAGQDLIKDLLEHSFIGLEDYLELILSRDLNIGVGVNTFNKVWGDIIPFHTIMKAESITADEAKNLTYPLIAQNKYDGCRCAAQLDLKTNKVKFLSSNGNILDMPNLELYIIQFWELNSDKIRKAYAGKDLTKIDFDGELVSNTRIGTSALITKFVRNTANDGDDKNFIYYIWDILPGGAVVGDFKSNNTGKKKLLITHIKQTDRYDLLQSCHIFSGKNIQKAETIIANTPDEMLDFYSEMISRDNGEGIIIKTLDGFYERGDKHRSSVWMKLKMRNEADLKVIGFELAPVKASIVKAYKDKGLKIPDEMVGALICRSDDDIITVNVGSGISDEQRIAWKENPDDIVGSIVEVQYFDIVKDSYGDYSLYLPALSRIRDDKNEANTAKEIADITGFDLK